MAARSCWLFSSCLLFANVGLGSDTQTQCRAQPATVATPAPKQISSAREHLHIAAQQLEAAGLVQDAAKLRELSEQLKGSANGEARVAQQLKSRPNKIVCRCRFVELSAACADEFFEAAGLPTSGTPAPRSQHIAVYKNAEEALRTLELSGKARILGGPTFDARIDEPANVMTGGEFPILIPQAGGKTEVQWKWFGIRCTAVVQWCDNGRLDMNIMPEIAVKDFKNAVVSGGLTIPGLTTRRANLRQEMNLGETAVLSFGPNPDDQEQASLRPLVQAAIRLVDSEVELPLPAPKITLFMVTPVAVDSAATKN